MERIPIMKYLLPILFAFCFLSCQRHSDKWDQICDIENYIETRPDSALTVLEAIDVKSLSSDEERAKYALYMSMALDKNYIDNTDFEVLQPAIDYYENHGSATDKLRTLYYQGRIYQNGGDNEKAMNCFVNALESSASSYDHITIARCFYSQGTIYQHMYDWKKVIESNINASNYFKSSNNVNSQFRSLLRAINGYSQLYETNRASEIILQANTLLSQVSLANKGFYYATCISFYSDNEMIEELRSVLSEYIYNIPKERIDWISVAYAYTILNDYEMANSAILNISGDQSSQARYYALVSDIYRHNNDFKGALTSYEKYIHISDSLDLVIFEQDTKFIEERHQLEMATIKEQEKKKQIIALFATIVSILVLIAIWINSRLRLSKREKLVAEKETERYKLLYAQMEDERDNLNALLQQNEEPDPEAMNAVARRLELLNKFFTAYITDNSDIDRKASKEMEELLEDKEKFMDSNRLAYAGSHPKFIKYLQDKGLTEWEINYCCLYALGLKGKEVGAYIKMRSHYNNSSEVREKLGISEHDTNLGIYIRKLVKSFSE
mgnify:FL=1